MARFIFRAEALAALVRAGDARRYKVDLVGDRDAIIKGASDAALNAAIDLSRFQISRMRRKHCVIYSDYSTHLALRAISRFLRRKKRVDLPSRDKIIRGIIETLLDSSPMFVIRRDISSFYETIPVAPIRDALIYDISTPVLIRDYIRNFFEVHCPTQKPSGLPRGVGLSALFAELAMKEFDQKVRTMPGVFKYYRFSDDIVIFSTSYDAGLGNQIEAALPRGMTFNPVKCFERYYQGRSESAELDPLEYLGYVFHTTQSTKRDVSRIVRVGISERKINRLKTRVILSLRNFETRPCPDYRLLRDRCRFITSNYKVRRHGTDVQKDATHVYSGIYYNYKMCGVYQVKGGRLVAEDYDAAELKGLDGFYHSILKKRARQGALMYGPQAISELRSFSFHRGYTHRIKVRFTPERIAIMKRAWFND